MDWTKHPPQPAGLSLLERGALIALEEIYFIHGELPASEKQILRACCAVSKLEIAAVASVLRQFFVLGEEGWKRAEWDALVVQAMEIKAKRSAAANTRWAQVAESQGPGPSKSNANASALAMHVDMQREEREKKDKTSSSLKEEEGKEGLRGLLSQWICTTGWNAEDEARAGRLIEQFGAMVIQGMAAEVEKETGRRPFLSRVESRLLGGSEDSHRGFAGKDYMMGGGYVQDL